MKERQRTLAFEEAEEPGRAEVAEIAEKYEPPPRRAVPRSLSSSRGSPLQAHPALRQHLQFVREDKREEVTRIIEKKLWLQTLKTRPSNETIDPDEALKLIALIDELSTITQPKDYVTEYDKELRDIVREAILALGLYPRGFPFKIKWDDSMYHGGTFASFFQSVLPCFRECLQCIIDHESAMTANDAWERFDENSRRCLQDST